MSDDMSPFEIKVDFAKPLAEFHKFTDALLTNANAVDKLTRVWSAYRKDLGRVYENTTTLAKGFATLKKEIYDQERGYASLTGVITRYQNISRQVRTDTTLAVRAEGEYNRVLRDRAAAVNSLNAVMLRYRGLSAISVGPGTFAGGPRNRQTRGGTPGLDRAASEAAFYKMYAGQDDDDYYRLRRQGAAVQPLVNKFNSASDAERLRQIQRRNAYFAPLALPSINQGPPGGYKPPNVENPFGPQGGAGGQGNVFSQLNLGHATRIFLTYSALRQVAEGFNEVSTAAFKTSKAISEIQTITQRSGVTFAEFKQEILGLSSAFGLVAEDVAEGTYQAISNQVVDAAHSYQFMSEAAKFATVTQTTLAQAVEILSSGLNSYNLKADQAANVSATLFKTIEIGRIRGKELTNTLGTVAVMAGELGIPLKEVGAALAVMTDNGIKTQNAMTYLRGLMTKLLKPTEDMNELVKHWNYSSAQAAIETEHLSGFMTRLASETDASATKFAELFHDIRPLQAVIALSGKGVDQFTEALRRFDDESSDYKAAFDEIMDVSPTLNLNREIQKLRNSWVSLFMDVQTGAASLAKGLGGLTVASHVLVGGVSALIVRYSLFKTVTTEATAQAAAMEVVQRRAMLTMNGLKAAFTGTALAANVLAAGVGILVFSLLQYRNSMEESRQETERLINETFADFKEQVGRDQPQILAKLTERFKLTTKAIIDYGAATNDALDKQKAFSKDAYDNVNVVLSRQKEALQTQISEFKKYYSTIEQIQKDSNKNRAKLSDDLARDDFEKQLEGADPDRQRALLTGQIEINRARAKQLATLAPTDISVAEARRLNAQAIEDLKRLQTLGGGPDARDKSGAQLREENAQDRRLRKLDMLNKLERLNVDVTAEKRELLADIETSNSTIAELEQKRQNNSALVGPTVAGQLRDTKREQLEIEESISRVAEADLKFTQIQIDSHEKTVDNLEDIARAWKDIGLETTTAVSAMQAVAGQVILIKNLQGSTSVGAAISKSISEQQSALALTAEAKARESQRVKNVNIQDLLTQVVTRSPSMAADSMEKVGAILSQSKGVGPLISGSMSKSNREALEHPEMNKVFVDRVAAFRKDFEVLILDLHKQADLVTSLKDKGYTAEAAGRAVLSPEQQKFIKSANRDTGFLNAIGLDKDQIKLIQDAAKAIGVEQPNKSTKIISENKLMNELIGTLQKFGERSSGQSKTPFTQSEFDLLIPALNKAGIKTDGLIDSLEELNQITSEAPVSINATSAAMSALIARLQAATGIATYKSGEAEGKGKPSGVAVPGDSRAFGGYSAGGGRHHAGEYVVNKYQTFKNMGLLEALNKGDETFMLGQQGGRTGRYNLADLVSKYMTYNGNFPYFYGQNHGELGLSLMGLSGLIDKTNTQYGLGENLGSFGRKVYSRGWSVGSNPARNLNQRGGNSYSFGDIHVGAGSSRAVASEIITEIRRQTRRGYGSI